MVTSYFSRSDYSNIINNVLNPLLPIGVNLFNSNIAIQYPNINQYSQTLINSTSAYPQSKITNIKIGAPIKTMNGAIYKQWSCQPFAFVFDWFPGLVMINGWSIEILMQMSLNSQFHQIEGILPFCLNKPNTDQLDWDSCLSYSHQNISSWQINKPGLNYPANWLGTYFKENLGINHNYEGQEHLAYWLTQWKNNGLIPKICIFGLYDCDGNAIFNPYSATDEITLSILNEYIPNQIENVHIDAYTLGVDCLAVLKPYEISLSEEYTINNNLLATTINYLPGVLPLPYAGQYTLKINPDSGTTWSSYNGGETWYYDHVGDLQGPYDVPYWGNYSKIILPDGTWYWG